MAGELPEMLPLSGAPYDIDEDDDLTSPELKDEEYPTYTQGDTRVISGPIGPRAKFPGTRHETWRDAQVYVASKYNMCTFWCMPGRWFARIQKEPMHV
jgi:hypothetical protein